MISCKTYLDSNSQNISKALKLKSRTLYFRYGSHLFLIIPLQKQRINFSRKLSQHEFLKSSEILLGKREISYFHYYIHLLVVR